jgi:putative ABC transport system substrate-binding protein
MPEGSTMRLRAIGILVIFALILGVLAAPLAAEAQQPTKVHRIGWLGAGPPPPEPNPWLEAFRQGLRDLGYVEGQNITIEERYAAGKPERLPALAAELVQRPVDVLVAAGPVVQVAKQATSIIPIVMATGGVDPVVAGLVASLERPGGNVTGVALSTGVEIAGKWVELLQQALGQVSRVAVLWDPTGTTGRPMVREVERVAPAVGLQVHLVEARDAAEFDDAFAAMTRAGAEALIVLSSGTFDREGRRLVVLAARHRLPAIYEHRRFVDAGGLMSYGANVEAMIYRAAYYVDRILKGAKPADLPVEQPTKFEWVINLKTAKALGLTIPSTLLFQADEVIQ